MNKVIKISLVAALVLSVSVAVSALRGVQGDTLDCSNPLSLVSGHILSNGEFGGGALAIVSNNSDCTFDIGFASYKMTNMSPDPRSDQTLYDSATVRLTARQTAELHISVPDCRYQLDLFHGPVLTVPNYDSVAFAHAFVRENLCAGPASTPVPATPTPVPPTPTPVPGNNPPIGVFDVANCDIIGGWVFDPDAPSESLAVSIYRDGPPGIGSLIITIQPGDNDRIAFRPDVNAAYGITGLHGWNILTPASLKDGATHEIWVVARDVNTGVFTLFENRKFLNTASCVPATPTPVPATPTPVPATPTPTPCVGGTLLVNSNNPDATYVISGPNGTINATGTQTFTNQATGTYTISINGSNNVINAPTTNILLCNSTLTFNIINNTVINPTPAPTPFPTFTPIPTPAFSSLSIAKTVRNLTANTSEVESVNANQNETVEFVIRIMAPSNQIANNVRVTDSLPYGLTYVPGSTTIDNGYSNDGITSGGLNLGSFSAGRQMTLRFRATVNQAYANYSQYNPYGTYGNASFASTTITNSASVVADNAPSVSDTATVLVLGSNAVVTPNTLNVHKTGRNITRGDTVGQTSLTARPGDGIEFTISVTAPTNTNLNNVIVTDSLPAGMTYTVRSTTVNNATIANDGIVSGGLNIGTIAAGQTAKIVFYATVNANVSANQIIINTASARADNVGLVNSNPVQITIGNNVLQAALRVRTGPAGTAFAVSGFGALMATGLYYGRRKFLGSILA